MADENGRAEIDQAETSGGGAACNVAINLKKLAPELPVASIGLVNNDLEGRFLLSLAKDHGIDHERMSVIDEAATDYTFAVSSLETGQRTHFSFYGTSGPADARSFRLHSRRPPNPASRPAWPSPGDGWRLAGRGKRLGSDAQSDALRGPGNKSELSGVAPERLAELARPCLAHLDLLVVNDAEIGAVSGIETVLDGRTDPQACIAAAKAVVVAGTLKLVAVHFPMGAVLVDRGGTVLARPSVRVPQTTSLAPMARATLLPRDSLRFPRKLDLGRLPVACPRHRGGLAAANPATGAVDHWSSNLDLAALWGWRDGLW